VNIPTRLKSLLQKDDNLTAAVLHAISVVRPWFEDNKLVFFPEYTDHGPKHIQEVFETAESLITENAWTILNSKDVAVLILGIILHDCAMHLSEDGFVSLISDDSRPLDEGFRDQPWPRLWHDFMAEAGRFDDRKLKALFDDMEPVRVPPLDPLMMTKRDRLLIGEFLRRHHPRLAHEIALTGVPGPPDKGLSLGEIPSDVRELSGLVARSHGLDLRVSVDYLNDKGKWGARRTVGVHVTYLMVLVRIADYLQIHSTRAPKEVLQVRSLRSPVSRGEWRAHEDINDIHQETDDPEAIWVEAKPKDVKTYLKLKYLVSDIQREMDESWAVLGEVYGPKDDLRGFGIKLRRIRSNIQNIAAFARTVNYVPKHAVLQTAGVDLLKLLVTPLYGDRPEVGVRELLQNAVDARLELLDYLAKDSQVSQPDLQEQSADVVIALTWKEDGPKWLSVSDRGIGMTVDTVLNYFLKAGASFRFSHAWRRQHEDEQGRPRVLRSGRFGIGILAGFLLGDEIHVSTRHVTARPDEGVSFVCRLEDDTVQLDRITRPVGTTVSIQLPEAVFRKLAKDCFNWDGYLFKEPAFSWYWYCLEEPSAHFLIQGRIVEQTYVLPSADSDLPPEWRRVRHPAFRDIHWTYLGSALPLTCNGIAVIDLSKADDEDDDEDEDFGGEGFTRPKLSVFDPRGSLPLNLQRTGLSVKELPFEAELLKDICYDILAFLLVHTPGKRPLPGGQAGRNALQAEHLRHPGANTDRWILFTRDGLALLELWDIQHPRVPEIYALTSKRLLDVVGNKSFRPQIPFFGDKELKNILSGVPGIGGAGIKGSRVILSKRKLDSLTQRTSHYPKDDFLERKLRESWHTEWENDTWLLMKRGDCPPQELKLDKLPPEDGADPSEFLTIIYPGERPWGKSLLAETWRETMDLPYIPYDLEKRREFLPNAYRHLASYVQAWEKIRSHQE
jgi:molecular chaperone HtpG